MKDDFNVETEYTVLSGMKLPDHEKTDLWASIDAHMAQEAGAKRRASRSGFKKRQRSGMMAGVASVAAVIVAAGAIWAVKLGTSTPTGGQPPNSPNPVVAANQTPFRMAVLVKYPASGGSDLMAVTGVVGREAASHQHLLLKNATWAKFSPDGKWIAVAKADTTSSGESTTSLYLVRNGDDYKPIRVLAKDFAFGEWMPGTDQFVYGANQAHELNVVAPGNTPKPYSIPKLTNSVYEDIHFSPDGKRASVLESVNPPDATHGPDQWYDKVVTYPVAKPDQQTVLVQSKAPDGLALGPWAADGQSIFYWDVPLHSASLSADGSVLWNQDLQGQKHKIGTTPMNFPLSSSAVLRQVVVPFGEGDAAVQMGAGRDLGQGKTVAVYEEGNVVTLGIHPSEVELSPDVNHGGLLVAYTAAPADKAEGMSTGPLPSWVNQSKLRIYNLDTHKAEVLDQAGTGIQTPVFESIGSRILYIKDHSIWSIDSTTGAAPMKVADLPNGTLIVLDHQ